MAGSGRWPHVAQPPPAVFFVAQPPSAVFFVAQPPSAVFFLAQPPSAVFERSSKFVAHVEKPSAFGGITAEGGCATLPPQRERLAGATWLEKQARRHSD